MYSGKIAVPPGGEGLRKHKKMKNHNLPMSFKFGIGARCWF
jgi:hypothetical protein